MYLDGRDPLCRLGKCQRGLSFQLWGERTTLDVQSDGNVPFFNLP